MWDYLNWVKDDNTAKTTHSVGFTRLNLVVGIVWDGDSYFRIKIDILNAATYRKSLLIPIQADGKVTCSVTASRGVDPRRTSSNSALLHSNPCEDSQAWKKYSYLDGGSARGTVWYNRRRIQCTVACIESDSNTGGNQIWQSCVKILICLGRISTAYFSEKWKSMLTAACQRYIFTTSELNRETSSNKRK